ncbi:S-adenosyl-L-methionine-dependent methyltransferase [Suillus clintonianus]|uniref:S-adenosyl-L-methionine-dependent methyltransferase n=1 Tax=Suillus clintonianus TaxID=1904413 RepID=UPI001B880646|nr:S-adenosyl-L-methionine-dependent methyltransferase [Suillus clintonianus]KAG2132400.1 S-adenosyl-L-methionine-dependent methyltransferase [Suillus clintonianus]
MLVRAIEFYSGIGGLHLALRQSRVASSPVKAFDWDQTACQVYAANYGPKIISRTDISTLTAIDLLHLHADVWLLSPSCQPYTVLNPSARGEADPRAKSFLHLIDHVLPDLAAQDSQPRYMLIENVAGFQDSTTRRRLVDTLQRLGYVVAEFLLTPVQFGIPNSRLRYYLLAKLSPLRFSGLHHDEYPFDRVHERIPGTASGIPVHPLREYLDPSHEDGNYLRHNIPDRVLVKWGRLFDIVLPSGRRTCCFTRGYTRLVERAGSILQVNEDLDTTEVFDKFLEARSRGDEDAVRILDQLHLRYFTPSELLKIFRFEELEYNQQFLWPPTVSLKSQYRLIGNSINVEVVRHLINYLFDGEEHTT